MSDRNHQNKQMARTDRVSNSYITCPLGCLDVPATAPVSAEIWPPRQMHNLIIKEIAGSLSFFTLRAVPYWLDAKR